MEGEVSPTSSRKRVPRCAASKRPFLFWCASVKDALHVAEQLALQERVGKGPAVHGDEGTVAAGREGVDGPRHQLLARAALAA